MTDSAFASSTVPSHLRIPKYRLHKPKGLAVVTLRGRDTNPHPKSRAFGACWGCALMSVVG